jgi:1-deoxy-D-xylulose-5-phosphate synthase
VGPFASAADPAARVQTTPTDWSAAVGDALVERARVDARICALTAGMTDGTGLSPFAAAFPSRFFDVGIAEEHLVAFAAGLAAGGRKPVIAVYSTFLQRAVDQVMHDVCLPNLPVVFCVDRAGIVGADGATHQGVFDLAMLRCLPNLTICQPKDAVDLRALLDEALARQGPTLIRYPRGRVPESVPPAPEPADARVAIWTTGDWYPKAAAVAARVGGCRVVHARQLKPFDAALLARQRAEGLTIVSLENGSLAGGFGEAIGADIRFGWPDTFIPHGTPDELERRFGLDVDSIVAALQADGRARRKRDSETRKEQET